MFRFPDCGGDDAEFLPVSIGEPSDGILKPTTRIFYYKLGVTQVGRVVLLSIAAGEIVDKKDHITFQFVDRYGQRNLYWPVGDKDGSLLSTLSFDPSNQLYGFSGLA